MIRYRLPLLLLWLLPPLLAGCISLAAQRFSGDLNAAILNQDDPETVHDGAPAYLLLIDGLIEDDPDNEGLLIAGARLYGAYASAFVKEPERARRLAAKARDYGRRALCLRRPQICTAEDQPYEAFTTALEELNNLPALYAYGAAWAGWIQVNSDDWNAVADLPKVEAVLERVIALDDAYDRGRAHLYLAVMRTQLPSNLGGKPEEGRRHFEKAIAISGGRDLLAKVEFAKRYARLVFDKTLYDHLLREVLAADPHEPGLTLSNVLAQQQARDLLKASDEYFPE